MKIKVLIAALAAPFSIQAATISLPAIGSSATSQDPFIDGDLVAGAGLLINAAIDITNPGTATTGSWSGAATGGTGIELLDVLGGTVAGVDLQTQTAMTNTAIDFNSITTTTGLVGSLLSALNLDSIVTAGLVQTWEASVNLTQLGLVVDANTTYNLTFDLGQSTSLLGALSPAVFNQFTAVVGDDSGTYGQGALPAGLLGITDIFGDSGTATLTFTTGAAIDGDVIATFGATALADTDLLDGLLNAPNTTLYSVSGLDISAVPEPSALLLSGVFIGMIALRRRRCM